MKDGNKIADGICNCDNGKIRHKPNQSHSEFVTLLQTTLSMFFVMLYLTIKSLIFILLIRYIISASGDFYQ